MDSAIKHHLGKEIVERTALTGGYTFQTWLLTLSDNQKIIFRTQRDFETGGGRKIIIADILEREKFFYDNINKEIGPICPDVYVIDGSRDFYENSFCIMEYMEGTPLDKCFNDFDAKTKNTVLYTIGEIAARINSVEIDSRHPYVTSRGVWEGYIVNRLRERLTPLVHNKFILDAENCEFGDPLYEIAVIDVGNELEPAFLAGYQSVCSVDIETESGLYQFYKMERQALVTDVFANAVKNDKQLTTFHVEKFYELKQKLL